MENLPTAPNYIPVETVDRRTGESRAVCLESLELPFSGTTQRAVAQVLLERGGVCGRSCPGGALFAVPDLRQGMEPQHEGSQQLRPDEGMDGAVAGVLLGHDGEPVGQATVVLCDAETGIPVSKKTFKPFIEGRPDLEGMAAVTTDAGGRFRFGEVPAGPYRLVAQSWPEAPGVAKVFEKNGTEIILRGVANDIRVPSKEAQKIEITPLGTCAVHLDEDFPNSDALLVVSTKPLSADPVLGFVSWQGPFLQNMLGANRMPKGVTTIGGLPEGEVHLSVFANDNNGGIGAGSAVAKPGELVQADDIPIVCGWSNGRHDPPPELLPTFAEVKAIAERQNNHAIPILDGLLAAKGVVVDRIVDARNPMRPYYSHLDVVVSLPSERKVRFAEVLACVSYLDLQRRVEQRRKKEGR